MYLLIGDAGDLCCQNVRTALETRGYPTHLVENPLVHPAQLTWQFDTEQSSSQLVWGQEPPVDDKQILGVLVRGVSWIDPHGWEHEDLIYMQAEMQAALLAWLWSLACPVINRFPPTVWYRPQASVLSWHRLLRQCGLPTLETLVTNVIDEAREFGHQLALKGVPGAVYGPLISATRYAVTNDEAWDGLAAMQRIAPVCLVSPHGAVQRVCVVNEQVVWDGEPAVEMYRFDPALRAFATAAGLALVELVFAPSSDGVCVIAVEPQPDVEQFGEAERQQIIAAIVDLLAAQAGHRSDGSLQAADGSAT